MSLSVALSLCLIAAGPVSLTGQTGRLLTSHHVSAVYSECALQSSSLHTFPPYQICLPLPPTKVVVTPYPGGALRSCSLQGKIMTSDGLVQHCVNWNLMGGSPKSFKLSLKNIQAFVNNQDRCSLWATR